MKFKYFNSEDTKIQDINKVQNALSLAQNPIIVDAEYFPLLEAAENGDIFATAELAEAFRKGRKGIPRNYNLAKYYASLMLENAEDNISLEVEALHNSGYLEYSFGNHKQAIHLYKKALFLMHNFLPPEEWTASLYSDMQKAITAIQKP